MPHLDGEETGPLAAYEHFLKRRGVIRRPLRPGEELWAGSISVKLVEFARVEVASGGCGNSVGLRARVVVAGEDWSVEATLGPEPRLTRVGALTLAVEPGGEAGAVTICAG